MCQLFVEAESEQWLSRTKSLRIEGVVTSIRLENFFWDVLAEIAFRDDMSVNQLITKLYFESREAELDLSNFTSFLRVCCSRYLSLVADGELTRCEKTPMKKDNIDILLSQENQRTLARRRCFTREPSV
ncbi:MAG: intracellular proteinase I [Alteromonadaceae bacterium]|jgi:predicted DNA-binding ribbon-helix-helix protein|uniref:Intracellular proteinase I n=2 Tax=Paraglaciecola mesophila TaxID=197222 RepID=K6XPU3_9ALTE|nr:ribbon-helix-helix domain-containing protein [Paraglaciecola mesophila]MAD17758.1 intracellular proteinase I [Alteromonadaceae bacterium]MBB18279.1 intracellular proteinase I [Rickettsiales bacterium]GAC22674.1 intracellular proteinase I [Paraglaciecola mesophila KMM 241]|tara:strand:+ start:2975 stop:3361 length:387 start_codon:yes stop_codon:yes gene_type:complete